MATAEAKAKRMKRHEAGIREFQAWLSRQPKKPTRALKVEMFDFFIDEAAKRR